MKGQHILIIDDDEDIPVMLKGWLVSQGFEVDAVSSGKEAQAYLAKHKPDLFLLDVMMPDMNGLELCKWIRSRAPTQDIPIIQMSALRDETTKADSLEMGSMDYVSKPFTLAVLGEKIEMALKRANNRKKSDESG